MSQCFTKNFGFHFIPVTEPVWWVTVFSASWYTLRSFEIINTKTKEMQWWVQKPSPASAHSEPVWTCITISATARVLHSYQGTTPHLCVKQWLWVGVTGSVGMTKWDRTQPVQNAYFILSHMYSGVNQVNMFLAARQSANLCLTANNLNQFDRVYLSLHFVLPSLAVICSWKSFCRVIGFFCGRGCGMMA